MSTMRVANIIFKSGNLTARLRSPIPRIVSSSSICSKELRDPNYQKPKPFPYETRKYTYLHWYIDSTLKRFDENTKIIVVDGNIGAGKTSFAKELANTFDMKFIPEPTMDRYYTTPSGHDLRLIDDAMPEAFKTYDIKKFYENPHHLSAASFQLKMFMLRYVDYIEALAHLFNTGQGIVFDRSAFSDFVFMDTMLEMGYVRKEARDHYHKVFQNCIVELLRPHLVIYLDVTPEVALQRIKERNNPMEANSKVLTKEYLESIEHLYKTKHFNSLKRHTDILNYDWNNYGDVEVVVEDIERISFERDKYSDRLCDWFHERDWDYGLLRHKYTNDVNRLLGYAALMPYDADELLLHPDDIAEYQNVMEKVPGMKYIKGYNMDIGDKVIFKGPNFGTRDQIDYFPHIKP